MRLNPRTAAAVLIFSLMACARMMAPGGGPVDDTPPEIVSVSPSPGPGSGDLKEIEIQWSERLDESAALFLYPDLPHSLKVSGSGITVSLDDTLGLRTLVIHVPRECSDRRGNQTPEATDLVYSGLDSLPAGVIDVALTRQGGGNVSSRTLVEVWIDGAESELLRRTSADSTGSASIAWLEPHGEYRILCYEDPDVSFQWSSDREAGADTTVSLVPGADSVSLAMTLTVVDTVGPVLVEAEALDAFHLRLEFTEEISLGSYGRGEVVLSDTAGEEFAVSGSWLGSGITDESVILETTRSFPSEGEILVLLEGVRDLLGNPSMPDSMSVRATDSLPTDTLRVRSHYPAPGSMNTDPSGPYNISFTFAVSPEDLLQLFTLTRISDSTLVEGTLEPVDGRSFIFTPDHQLIGEQQHRFDLLPGLGTPWGDTMESGFSWVFVPLWGDEPGAVSGSVSGTGAVTLTIQLSRTGGGGDASVRYATVQPGSFILEDIPAGRYTLSAFVDMNSSGAWDPAEPYGTYPGVIMVQPGLTSEDIDVHILP